MAELNGNSINKLRHYILEFIHEKKKETLYLYQKWK